MIQPRISQINLWQNHEKRVIEVLRLALALLQNNTDLLLHECNEESLNRELYFTLLDANRVLRRQDPLSGLDCPPTAEGRNPPHIDDTSLSKRKKKIPDFYWGYIDDLETDPRRSARNFYIECKRLGKPLKKDEVLTRLYIQKGICRFITEEHGYAKDEESSAMVGYVQNMKFDVILDEVNVSSKANLEPISPLLLSSNGWQEKGVSELVHDLERSFPISPIRIYHFWVDVRSY